MKKKLQDTGREIKTLTALGKNDASWAVSGGEGGHTN